MRKGPENRTYDLEMGAGGCSVSYEHLAESYEMAEIQVSDGRGGMQQALTYVRFVGLKSRTEHEPSGKGMGMDFDVYDKLIKGETVEEKPPSILLARQFVRETGVGVATEIMIPSLQMPFYEGRILDGKFLPWNPSNEQLGWPIRQIAEAAARHNWTVGLKNGKWLGESLEAVTRPDSEIVTSMEKTWLGLASYAAAAKGNIAFIHRGVDVAGKGEYRNALVHEVVKRLAKKMPDAKRYFDPSHSLGDKLRDSIVAETIAAMKMTVGNEYLYNGILIETGTSETDGSQHISIDELKILICELAKFRRLRGPI